MSDFEITKREIITSVSIIAILLLLGVLISFKITENRMDKNEMYNKAIKTENQELFEYGMRTNIGNAFVYGDLKAVDTVSYPEINKKCMYVLKIKEQYTQHTRTVDYTDSNGKRKTRTETYWSWDEIGRESKKCKEISFCGVKFNSNKIDIPGADYICTIKESYYIRYKYYGTGTKFTGTIFTKLENDTISDNTKFYNDKTIEETVKRLESNVGIIVFWVFWILLICGCVYGFYYLDNTWLE